MALLEGLGLALPLASRTTEVCPVPRSPPGPPSAGWPRWVSDMAVGRVAQASQEGTRSSQGCGVLQGSANPQRIATLLPMLISITGQVGRMSGKQWVTASHVGQVLCQHLCRTLPSLKMDTHRVAMALASAGAGAHALCLDRLETIQAFTLTFDHVSAPFTTVSEAAQAADLGHATPADPDPNVVDTAQLWAHSFARFQQCLLQKSDPPSFTQIRQAQEMVKHLEGLSDAAQVVRLLSPSRPQRIPHGQDTAALGALRTYSTV